MVKKAEVNMAGEQRKERSDKKKAIAPLHKCSCLWQIARIGYVCDLPLKTIGEMLAKESPLFDSRKFKIMGDFGKVMGDQFLAS